MSADNERRARELPAIHGACTRLLSEIVCVHQTDEQLDDEVIPRPPVMLAVTRLREQLDKLSAIISTLAQPQCAVCEPNSLYDTDADGPGTALHAARMCRSKARSRCAMSGNKIDRAPAIVAAMPDDNDTAETYRQGWEAGHVTPPVVDEAMVERFCIAAATALDKQWPDDYDDDEIDDIRRVMHAGLVSALSQSKG